MRIACLAVFLASMGLAAGDKSFDLFSRDLAQIGTVPDVDIEYDGSSAQCDPGTGRRFHGESVPPGDQDCSDPQSWVLTYTLSIGVITIKSCAKDKFLQISSTNPGAVPTADDCNFLSNTASDIVLQPAYNDKLSLEAQSVKGMNLICGWPSGVDMTHTVDFAAEAAYQRDIIVLFDGIDQDVIINKPVEDFMYDEFYNSLCFAQAANIGPKYVVAFDTTMAAKTNLDPPCAGESDMMIGGPNMVDMFCQNVPQDASLDTVDWASGNCFGRCGSGCGTTEQFTNDCVDYDFCNRFGVNREGPPGSCAEEFYHTIDDSMFSGNCDETGMETTPECITPPVPAPVAAPTPAPFSLPQPVLITFAQGGDSCEEKCPEVGFGCTPESQNEQNFRFQEDLIDGETMGAFGIGCKEILDSSDPAEQGTYDPSSGLCVPIPDSGISPDCDEPVPDGKVRFCTCYS